MKIAVVGAGYVGLSNAVMLARHHEVVVLDTDAARVTAVNARISPFADAHLQEYLGAEQLNLHASSNAEWVIQGADVFVAVPTNLDSATGQLDTSGLDDVLARVVAVNPDAVIAIRSTVPIGFTASATVRHGARHLYFVPEFLREGQALHDSLYPSRIVVGGAQGAGAQALAQLLVQEAVQTSDVPVLLMGSQEAEAVKLLSNAYLALRVAFFNEVDSLAWGRNLNARALIDGIGLDPRIGSQYNNPSFGFGGYCLPKDVQQLQSEWPTNVPHAVVDAIARSNDERVQYMAQAIAAQSPQCVGIYRLVMKAGSDNWRGSSSLVLVRRLRDFGVRVIIHEPLIMQSDFEGCTLVPNLHRFKIECDLIVANRRDAGLLDVASKVFSRDLFGEG